jgi:hypothetical protein
MTCSRLPATFHRGILPAVPIPPATASRAGFPNLSATSRAHDPPTIFRQVTLLGLCLQGFLPSLQVGRLIAARSSLSTLLPRQAPPSFLVEGSAGVAQTLGKPTQVVPSSGICSEAKSICTGGTRLGSSQPICPSWPSTSSWSLPGTRRTNRATALGGCLLRCQSPHPRHSVASCAGRPLSRERNLPSQGFSPPLTRTFR